MDPVERVIGKLEEFKSTTTERLDRIEIKVDRLQEFKWRVAGGAALLCLLFSVAAELFLK